MLLSEILVDRRCSSGCTVPRPFVHGFMNPQCIFSRSIDLNVRVGSLFPMQSCCMFHSFFSTMLNNNITVVLLCSSSLLQGCSVGRVFSIF